MKKVFILGGGTVYHVRPHLAISAPAYGKSARQLFSAAWKSARTLGLTKMAIDMHSMDEHAEYIGETNEQVYKWIDENIIKNPEPSIVFLNVAFCDFEGSILDEGGPTLSGKYSTERLSSSKEFVMKLSPAEKIVSKIRKERKDIFLVAFKTTSGATKEEQFEKGMNLLKKNSCNLVVANDIKTKRNVVLTPEMAEYFESYEDDRTQFFEDLVGMATARAGNEFTQTTISNDGKLIDWSSEDVPDSLRQVVDWAASKGAYKAYNDVTVGHFGFKPKDGTLWSSRRKKNFNKIKDRDLVVVEFEKDKQTAFGAKPSAGARSQYIVLDKYKDLDCIIHFHCPMLGGSQVPVRTQQPFECGSHQCGKNTADGMERFCNGQVAAVMLDKHGPNIVFKKDVDPNVVISFISNNFDLSKRTK